MSTVAIVDDHRAFSDRLSAFVNALPGWSVVGTAEDAVAGLALVRATRPTVVLVDVGLPDRNGFWFTEQALALIPGLRVIVMSDGESEEYAEAAVLACAFAYVAKHAVSRDLPTLLTCALAIRPWDCGGRRAAGRGSDAGAANERGSSPPNAAAGSIPMQRSGLSLTDFVMAGPAFIGYAAAGEPLIGATIAVALLALYRRWSPPRARRGLAGGRGP